MQAFGVELVELARRGKLAPVIGRDPEIMRVIEILNRRIKNNPILIGEPGVGKTAIVEGIAARIATGEVPTWMTGCSIFSLDLGALLAGTQYRGQFEERFKQVLTTVENSDGNILLFIDEIHTLMGAGGKGASDGAQIIKPLLGRGAIHCIGATTLDEYKILESDPAMERRFQRVVVHPPSVEGTIAILAGLKPRFEAHHGLTIEHGALVAAAKLSERYIQDRFLPDKAIDLVDEACAKARISFDAVPRELDHTRRTIERITAELLGLEDDPSLGAYRQKLHTRLRSLKQELDARQERWHCERERLAQLKGLRAKLKASELKLDIMRTNFASQAQKPATYYDDVAMLQYRDIPKLERQIEDLLNTPLGPSSTNAPAARTHKTNIDATDVDAADADRTDVDTTDVDKTSIDGTHIGGAYMCTAEHETQGTDQAAAVDAQALTAANAADYGDRNPRITPEDIAHIVSRSTGIQVTRLMASERERLLGLRERLVGEVVGQPEACRQVAEAVQRSRTGIADPNRPVGSFLFVGPSGVGKTELAKTLAKALFEADPSAALIRLDMSEYMEKASISRLIGSPPGYEGHSEGGQLTEAIRRKPYAVVLFDEIEKAHRDIFHLLLQILDEGYVTDASGRQVSFRDAVLILTSNLGSDVLLASGQKKEGGRQNITTATTTTAATTTPATAAAVDRHLRQHLRPELLNRLDARILFTPLGVKALQQVAALIGRALCARLQAQGVDVTIDDDVYTLAVRQSYDRTVGARALKRWFVRQIESPLALHRLSHPERSTFIVDLHPENGKLRFRALVKKNAKSSHHGAVTERAIQRSMEQNNSV